MRRPFRVWDLSLVSDALTRRDDRSSVCLRALLDVALRSLLRPHELLTRRFDDLTDTADGPCLVVTGSKLAVPQRRIVPLLRPGPGTDDALTRWIAVRGSAAGPLFCSARGTALNAAGVRRLLRAVAHDAQCAPFTLADVRKLGIVRALDAGVAPEILAAVTGVRVTTPFFRVHAPAVTARLLRKVEEDRPTRGDAQ